MANILTKYPVDNQPPENVYLFWENEQLFWESSDWSDTRTHDDDVLYIRYDAYEWLTNQVQSQEQTITGAQDAIAEKNQTIALLDNRVQSLVEQLAYFNQVNADPAITLQLDNNETVAILQERIEKLVQQLAEFENAESDVPADLQIDNSKGRVKSRGWIEEKMINGCGPYLYLRWREGKKGLKSKYLGKAAKD